MQSSTSTWWRRSYLLNSIWGRCCSIRLTYSRVSTCLLFSFLPLYLHSSHRLLFMTNKMIFKTRSQIYLPRVHWKQSLWSFPFISNHSVLPSPSLLPFFLCIFLFSFVFFIFLFLACFGFVSSLLFFVSFDLLTSETQLQPGSVKNIDIPISQPEFFAHALVRVEEVNFRVEGDLPLSHSFFIGLIWFHSTLTFRNQIYHEWKVWASGHLHGRLVLRQRHWS